MAWCSDHGLPHSSLLSWAPEDRAKLTAYLVESASRCQLCGTSPWEWEEDRHAYEAAIDQCWGCYVKEAANEDANITAGARVTLVPSKVAAERRAAGQVMD